MVDQIVQAITPLAELVGADPKVLLGALLLWVYGAVTQSMPEPVPGSSSVAYRWLYNTVQTLAANVLLVRKVVRKNGSMPLLVAPPKQR